MVKYNVIKDYANQNVVADNLRESIKEYLKTKEHHGSR